MATQMDTKKRLALAIIDFLTKSLQDGTISSEDTESVEVAQQGIADAFRVDPDDKAAMSEAIGNQSLMSIYGVYEKLKSKSTPQTGPSSSSSASGSSSTASSNATGATPVAPNAEAEAFKSKGNSAMASKDYSTAIDLYSKALNISPLNPIYLSNRAAAYSGSGRHSEASTDAEMAVAADPKYTKAWSRLGFARFALGDAKGSMEAYQKGIDYEGNGGSDAMKRGFETAKRKFEEEGDAASEDVDAAPASGPGGMPDLSALAGMFGGGGRGGGGGPDLSSIMSNPMFASMAQNLMSNPEALSGLMSNPGLRRMAENFGSGGGMPDMSALMADPSLAEMARNFMGGAGAGAGRGRGEQ